MDKKQLKKVTTQIYEEYGFVKKGKYYYLDLEDLLICSGFDSMYGVMYLAYNFSIKAIHSEEERKPNNMFDGYDSTQNEIYFDKYAKGYHVREIRFEDWTEEYYTDKLRELLHYYFDPYTLARFLSRETGSPYIRPENRTLSRTQAVSETGRTHPHKHRMAAFA